MDFEHDKIIQSARGLLTSKDASILRGTVYKLIERCITSIELDERGDIIRDFYIRLAKESIQLNNIQLTEIAVEGLKVKQLIKIVKTVVGRSDHERSTALCIIDNHLQHHGANIIQDKKLPTSDQTDFETLLKSCSSFHNPEKLENKLKSKNDELTKRMIYSTLASHNEANENFNDALTDYENSGTQYEHLPRTTMKHLICSTHQALQQYCATSLELQDFWFKYLIILRDYSEAIQFCEHSGTLSQRTRCMPLTHRESQKDLGMQLDARMPSLLIEFINDREVAKWFNQKRTSLIIDSIISSDASTRVQLAEILCRGIQYNEGFYTTCLTICLGFSNKFLDLVRIDHEEAYELAFMSLNGLFPDLADFPDIIVAHTLTRRKARQVRHNRVMFDVCLKLGLVDLALQYSSTDLLQADYIHDAPNYIEKTLQSMHQNSIETINPCLQEKTLIQICENLTRTDDKDLAMNVITTVIFSLTILLLKLEAGDKKFINYSLPISETMFGYLRNYLDKYAFHLSEILVRATNGLTLALRNNLDALADSEITRRSFGFLIESIAGRCMLEGRYKSSAMLYSHIEDNVNAIKSLMRTGEVDTVINYALLVKDFTVNRIAINYLKHLRVDSKVLEEFITKSQI